MSTIPPSGLTPPPAAEGPVTPPASFSQRWSKIIATGTAGVVGFLGALYFESHPAVAFASLVSPYLFSLASNLKLAAPKPALVPVVPVPVQGIYEEAINLKINERTETEIDLSKERRGLKTQRDDIEDKLKKNLGEMNGNLDRIKIFKSLLTMSDKDIKKLADTDTEVAAMVKKADDEIQAAKDKVLMEAMQKRKEENEKAQREEDEKLMQRLMARGFVVKKNDETDEKTPEIEKTEIQLRVERQVKEEAEAAEKKRAFELLRGDPKFNVEIAQETTIEDLKKQIIKMESQIQKLLTQMSPNVSRPTTPAPKEPTPPQIDPVAALLGFTIAHQSAQAQGRQTPTPKAALTLSSRPPTPALHSAPSSTTGVRFKPDEENDEEVDAEYDEYGHEVQRSGPLGAGYSPNQRLVTPYWGEAEPASFGPFFSQGSQSSAQSNGGLDRPPSTTIRHRKQGGQ
jgi:hypothetical protein